MSRALVWFRRDLRLDDHPALQAALKAGHAPVPVYIHAPDEEAPWAPGAASHAWLERSLRSLREALRAIGSDLIIRQGPSTETLLALAKACEAEAVYWHRLYEPASIARDSATKAALKAAGLQAESHNGALLVEPWTVKTGGGEPYRVFTPFWKNARQTLEGNTTLEAPTSLPAVPNVHSLDIAALGLRPPAREGGWDLGFWPHWQPGEAGAAELLEVFIDGALHGYKEQRNFPDRTGSSKLSPHLHFGEISPRRIVAALQSARVPAKSQPDLDHYYSELGWREFSHHLLFHFPHTSDENMNPRFKEFAWAEVDPAHLEAWQRGRTGVPIVDAGMRELYATGWMHNRVRMVVASFLTKNLRYHWIHGARWFWDTLVDASLPNNTQGWQWTAGTGADAAPYFRIFSPVAQAEKFDPKGAYIQRWVPELAKVPAAALGEPWAHGDLLQRTAPGYPRRPIVDLKASRAEALAAYSGPKSLPHD
ncbi:cryptochrome/photolyase family protein [Silanimonas sp.]|jgi:deoxyribodipyrimidine photo-lyase|uniref:cryptochrome/photolyase family protein n=1 Tax=Silanimonas sp. TaxID=1929290 RepID=UPI0037CAEB30